LRAITLAIMSNPIGFLIASLVTGAALVVTNWQKVKDFFSSFLEYIKSLIKPIGEAFSWIENTVSSIFAKNSPLKEFEKRKSIVTEIKAVHSPLKSNILNSGNPLLGNSIIKEFSNRNQNSFRIKSLIEEKKFTESDNDKIFAKSKFENKEQNKTQNITNNYTISIKAEPNQDVRSLADEVIKRIREKSRDVLFDTIDSVY
ncbi:DoxX family protein, partial [Wolbachia pipientis]